MINLCGAETRISVVSRSVQCLLMPWHLASQGHHQATIVLTTGMQDKWVLVFHKDGCRLPVPSQYGEMIEKNTNLFHVAQNTFSKTRAEVLLCVFCRYLGSDGASNMAVVAVKMVSGWIPIKNSVKEVSSQDYKNRADSTFAHSQLEMALHCNDNLSWSLLFF